jgi:hypothetical protein
MQYDMKILPVGVLSLGAIHPSQRKIKPSVAIE